MTQPPALQDSLSLRSSVSAWLELRSYPGVRVGVSRIRRPVRRIVNMPSATMRIFMVHGDPKRLRAAELSHWTGNAVAGPRSAFDGVVGGEESGGSGVDVLTGNDSESGKPAISIGAAETMRDRVKAHLDKDVWNQLVYVRSQDETLTNALRRHVEGRRIDPARHASGALVRIDQHSGATRPASDGEEREVVLEQINQVLPVLGVEVFVSAASQAGAEPEEGLATMALEQAAWPGRRIDASG